MDDFIPHQMMTIEEVVTNLNNSIVRAKLDPSQPMIHDAVSWFDIYSMKLNELDDLEHQVVSEYVNKLLPDEWPIWCRYVYNQRERDILSQFGKAD